VSVALS